MSHRIQRESLIHYLVETTTLLQKRNSNWVKISQYALRFDMSYQWVEKAALFARSNALGHLVIITNTFIKLTVKTTMIVKILQKLSQLIKTIYLYTSVCSLN